MRIRLRLWIGLCLVAVASAQKAPPKPQPTQAPIPQFDDVAEKAGLTVAHIFTSDTKYIVESNKAAIGAQVTVKAGTLVQINEVRGARAIFHRTICACTLGWVRTTR